MAIFKKMFGLDLFLKAAELVNGSDDLNISASEARSLFSYQQKPLDMIPSPVFYKDAECIYRGGNKAFEEYIGYSRKQFIGKTVFDISQTGMAENYEKADRELLLSGGIQRYESKVRYADGTFRDVVFKKSALVNDGGKVVGIIGVILDITDQKRSEARIQSLLAEKELILKEVHHRLKNNMTTVHDLLCLQAESLSDPSAAAAVRDASIRVQSMAVLYDKLFRSADFDEILIKAYLSDLVDAIISNFPNKTAVRVEKRIDDFILDAKRLQPLGIILNELITNAMKHAFSGMKEGVLSIEVVKSLNQVSVIVRDNGIGIPVSVSVEDSPGFGLTLVGLLTHQIDASIRIERRDGTGMIVEFEY